MVRSVGHFLSNFFRSLYVVFGLVLVWRGVWVILDHVDYWVFGGDQLGESLMLAVITLIVGVALLYFHDHKIDEVGHL